MLCVRESFGKMNQEEILHRFRVQKVAVDREIEEFERQVLPEQKRDPVVVATLNRLYGASASLLLNQLRVERVFMQQTAVNTLKEALTAIQTVNKVAPKQDKIVAREFAKESARLEHLLDDPTAVDDEDEDINPRLKPASTASVRHKQRHANPVGQERRAANPRQDRPAPRVTRPSPDPPARLQSLSTA